MIFKRITEISGAGLKVDWHAVGWHLLDAIDAFGCDDQHVQQALKDIENGENGLAFDELCMLFRSISTPAAREAMVEHLGLAAKEMRLSANELNF